MTGVVFSSFATESREWDSFKKRYVTPQGRVLDTANGNISHSEGQGVAMLFAAAYNDKASFESIWSWTRAKLQIREDHLFAWKWDPSSRPNVPDENNASDGDVLIAWALYLAYEKWQVNSYRHSADYIVADIRSKLIRQTNYGSVLLPGAVGFEGEQGVTVNLSYWVFPAFQVFSKYGHKSDWNRLVASGERLLREARFGPWDLPPDWLLIKGDKLSVVSDVYKPQFGYNAVRIPLYLSWADRDSASLLRPFASFWRDARSSEGGMPALVDLHSNVVGSHTAPPGFYSIRNFVNSRLGNSMSSNGSNRWKEHYYSASLRLMVDMAGAGLGVP